MHTMGPLGHKKLGRGGRKFFSRASIVCTRVHVHAQNTVSGLGAFQSRCQLQLDENLLFSCSKGCVFPALFTWCTTGILELHLFVCASYLLPLPVCRSHARGAEILFMADAMESQDASLGMMLAVTI